VKDTTEKKEKRKIPCLVFSRVVGYLRPVQYWNIAKRQEFQDRVPYSLGEKDEREGTGLS
jgi:anaerobic ribonucleoside-triphosphate reductase